MERIRRREEYQKSRGWWKREKNITDRREGEEKK